MARFFIDRPIFAWVIAIVIMLAGALSIRTLPVSQYPAIAPPSIVINASYPGASAKTLEDSVTQIIEQKMTGLDNLLYMSSTSDSYGKASVTLTFNAGTNPDIAQVQVQNKLQLAMPSLPLIVQNQGVQVAKTSASFLMVVGLTSDDGKQTQSDLSDYLISNVQDPLSRIQGVGEVQVFGGQYAMRIWLDPAKLVSFGLQPGDVNAAIRAQNAQVSAGTLGEQPGVPGQPMSATVVVNGQLADAAQFGAIVLRANADGSSVRLRDVARIELGAQGYGSFSRLNGQPSAGIGVQLSPTGNALATADAVKKRMAELKTYFPPGMDYKVPYDSSKFVRISIEQVVETLIEAVALVFVVMLLFLQNLRYTLIPTIVVPVALLGTFGMLLTMGYSINVLTLFGMVLAIGILVDDAIVVVENVERLMAEEGLSPRDATRKAMGQITGAVIGITVVLVSVFVPMAFFGGAVGSIYRQFSLSMVSAILFSAFLALTLTPALCASFLKPVSGHHERRGFYGWFNRGFKRTATGYEAGVARMLPKAGRWMLAFGVIVAVVGWTYVRLPSSFLPSEDQGYLIVNVQLPPGATVERTTAVMQQVEAYLGKQPEVDQVVSVIGFSFSGQGQNSGLVFVPLKDWSERKGAEHSAQAVAGRAFGAFMGIRDAFVFPLSPPPIPELGTATGFNFRLQDRGGNGHEALLAARNQMLGMAMQSKVLAGVRPSGLEDAPQLQVDIDRDKAAAQAELWRHQQRHLGLAGLGLHQ